MIVFLLLVIIAILLFGSSVVLGAIGKVLGFVVLVLAVFFGFYGIAAATSFAIEDVMLPVAIGAPTLGLLAYIISSLIVERQKAAAAARAAETKRLHESSISASAQPPIRFHSRAPSKEERKRLRGW